MITVRRQKNLVNAKLYFREHLGQGDAGLAETCGHWFGKGAVRLGLDEPIHAEAFERLCDNLHPQTGEQLTALTLPNRRIFFDFVVSAPKSVSALALTVGDQRLLALHDQAVETSLARLEEFAQTRVRVGNRDEDRSTSEIVAALFRHDSSRALDPQLHTHVVVFNATWDATELRWKALQAGGIYEALNYLTEVYRSELATGLKDLGYQLRRTRHGFEIEGISPELLRRFSQRRQQIEVAEAKLEARRGKPLSTRGRARIAAATRPAKSETLSSDQLTAIQRARLSSTELGRLTALVHSARGRRSEPSAITPSQALDHARDHLFERASVIKRHELFREALTHGRGDVRECELASLLEKRPEFIRVGRQLTTCETLRLERELIAWVNAQTGRHRPFAPTPLDDGRLNEAQRHALTHLLQSPDGVTRLGGGAGTGKTRVVTAFVHALGQRQQQVFVCAPTTGAVDVLRREGFTSAQTVQRLLTDEALQREIAGQVILVDEANLLSVGQLHRLFHVAKAQRCRIVLSGDTRQHHSVEAGDALRVLETHSQLRSVALNQIQRQKPEAYRAAVAEVAAGRIAAGYARLDQMGAIVETGEERHGQLATEYADSLWRGRSALVVSPTWSEIREVTEAVRIRLKTGKRLSGRETAVEVHESLDWTEAQKRDARNYRPGMILTFHKRTERFAPGEWAQVDRVENGKISVRKADGRHETLTKKQAGCFAVAETKALSICAGEQLLIQGNCRERRLINGQIVSVKNIDASGCIQLTDGRRIDRGFRSFTHGYCVTSHAAEGRTVDHVYLTASSRSFVAANREQFYVSVSRGRHRVRVFTDDREGLLASVRETSARLSAVELVQRLPSLREVPKPYVAPKISLR